MRMLASVIAFSLMACSAEENPVRLGALADAQGAEAFYACLAANDVTLIAAHRGGPASGYAENALATFQRVTDRTPVLLEVDIRLSGAGEALLIHDDTLDRTTTGTGPVSQANADALQAIRLTDNSGRDLDAPITRLDEALAWANGAHLLELDIKDTPLTVVLDAVRAAGAEDETLLIAYDWDTVAEIHAAAPDMMISAPFARPDDLAAFERSGVPARQLLAWTGTREIDPDHWARIEALGIPVFYGAFGAYDAGRVDAALSAGATVIVSDAPLKAARRVYGADMRPDLAPCADDSYN